jgi:hypothetical protein
VSICHHLASVVCRLYVMVDSVLRELTWSSVVSMNKSGSTSLSISLKWMWLDRNGLVMIMWLDRNVLVIIMWLDRNVLVMIMWLDCNVLVMIMWLASIFYFILLLEVYWWKSDLSLAPIYWYVTEWEIWGNLYYDPYLSDLMSLIYSQTCPCSHLY